MSHCVGTGNADNFPSRSQISKREVASGLVKGWQSWEVVCSQGEKECVSEQRPERASGVGHIIFKTWEQGRLFKTLDCPWAPVTQVRSVSSRAGPEPGCNTGLLWSLQPGCDAGLLWSLQPSCDAGLLWSPWGSFSGGEQAVPELGYCGQDDFRLGGSLRGHLAGQHYLSYDKMQACM